MTTLGELALAGRAVEHRLAGIDGVVGVAVGDKQVAGEVTGRPCLQVYVTTKLPPSRLGHDQAIPPGAGDLEIDVVEIGRLRPMHRYEAHPGNPWRPGLWSRSSEHRVLEGGMGLGTGHGGGTLGCFLEDADDPDGTVFALTNDHVLTSDRRPEAEIGRVVGHANRGFVCHGFCARAIGTIAAASGDGSDNDDGPWIDAGLVRLDDGVQYSPSMHRIGPVYGIRNLRDDDMEIVLEQGTQVLKRGRATGTTGGYLIGFDMHQLDADGDYTTATLQPHLFNQVIIKPNPVWAGGAGDAHFIDHCDSGSVCIDLDGNAIALMHRAGPAFGGGVALGTHLVDVVTWAESALAGPDGPVDLRIATADVTRGLVRTVGGGDPQASLNLLEASFQRLADIGIGREVWRLWGTHADEILHLVNTNARVATVWHRSGLPILLQHLVRLAGDPSRRMPATIDGEPIERCLDRFVDELSRHASAELRHDLLGVGPIPSLAGCSYDEVVHRLEVA